MKNIFLTFAFLLISFTGFSQIASGSSTVNIVLSEIMQIEVVDPTVQITVSTADHFINGNSSLETDHLKITSTLDYQVTAKVDGDFSNGVETIAYNKVNLTTSAGTGGNSTPSFVTSVALTTTETQVLSTDGGDVERYVNVLYTLEGGEHLLNIPTGTYSAVVTYQISPN